MSNNDIANYLFILLGFMVTILLILISVLIYLKYKTSKKDNKEELNVSNKTKVQQSYNIQSIFKFMDFDKIEDNMIIQKDGKRFLMIVKCQGINYDLMSEVEKNSVEQGFIQYLNTLRYPIQIYIQTRTVDLSGSLNTYKEKVREIGDKLAHKEFEYNQKVRSGNYNNNELDAEKFDILKAKNLFEYGTDIVNNTERMSLNRNILSKQYYIVLSYYSEENNNSVYGQEEINSIAFSELYTKCQSTISLLSVCGINGKILDSHELAELLYNAYNRDEAEIYDLNRAINAGYDSLYTTAPDVLEKRMKELDKQIEIDAIKMANDAIYKVEQESEKEKKLKEKEKNYDDIVRRMANLVLENNKRVLGQEVVSKAKEKIKNKKTKSDEKEVKTNEKEKNTRTRAPRKSA